MRSTEPTIRIPLIGKLPPTVPLRLADICQYYLIAPAQLAATSGLSEQTIEHIMSGRPIYHAQARQLVIALFLLTGWLATERDITDLWVRKPTLADLLMAHHLTASQLAQQSGLPLIIVQEMIRRTPMARPLALRVLAAFSALGYSYQLEDLDLVIQQQNVIEKKENPQ